MFYYLYFVLLFFSFFIATSILFFLLFIFFIVPGKSYAVGAKAQSRDIFGAAGGEEDDSELSSTRRSG